MTKHSRLNEIAFAVGIFLLPFVPKVVFRLPWLMMQNFTDGVFYLGYAMHFRELVDRVGLNYYAMRFGGIWPDALAFSVLGPEVGLVVVRYGLAGACCLALYLAFWRRYSRVAGVLCALAWAFNPAAVRLLQTAYVDVPAASFLCIGLALACLPGVGGFLCVVAGALFACAFWAHLHAAVALFFAGPLIVAVLWEQGWRRAVWLCGWLGAGFLVASAAGVLFYYHHFGLWDLTSPTRELLRTLRDGHILAPKLAWVDVVRQCPFWLGVVPLSIAAVCVGRRDRMLYGALFAFVGYVVFLLWGDVVGGGYSLSLFYYFSFALPAFVFVVGALLGNAGVDFPWKRFVAFASVLCIPVAVVGWNLANSPWACVEVALLAAVPAGILLPSRGRTFVLAVGIASAMVLTAIAPTSRLALGNYWKGDDLHVLSAARELAEILPAYQQKQSPLVFWYDDKDGSDLRMLQSFHLHEFTKWKDAAGGNIPFPTSADAGEEAVWRGGAGDMVVLAESPEALEPALEVLRRSAHPPTSIQEFQIPARAPIAHGALVTFVEPQFKTVSSLLGGLEFHRKTKVTGPDQLEFTTGPRKWNYDAVVALPETREDQAVRVVLEVKRGAVVVDLEESGSDGRSLSPVIVASAGAPVSTWLDIPASMGKKRLRIRNFSPHGVRSDVVLKEISIVELVR